VAGGVPLPAHHLELRHLLAPPAQLPGRALERGRRIPGRVRRAPGAGEGGAARHAARRGRGARLRHAGGRRAGAGRAPEPRGGAGDAGGRRRGTLGLPGPGPRADQLAAHRHRLAADAVRPDRARSPGHRQAHRHHPRCEPDAAGLRHPVAARADELGRVPDREPPGALAAGVDHVPRVRCGGEAAGRHQPPRPRERSGAARRGGSGEPSPRRSASSSAWR
jgi:hypothetical protein